ncbi:MAG: AraC family transcriptional regulator [Pseudomonadota bacterium]
MGEVTSLFARKVVAVAGNSVDPKQVLGVVGLDPDAPWDPKQMLREDDFYAMIELMAQQMPDATILPLIVGESMRPDEYGALGLAWKAAPNLLGSFGRVARYARLWTSIVQYELQEKDDSFLFIEHRKGERRLGMRISVEADLASGVSLSRQVTSHSFAPLKVYFKHTAPSVISHHEDYFGCEVHFEAGQDAMLLSRDSLSIPNALGDEGITQFLISHLDRELSEINDAPTLEEQTRQAIAKALSEGPPKMEDIARSLGFSARSFHRRLADHGLTFQMLAEGTRRELAEGLLRDDQYSLADIAFLTGFSEQSSFTRAFKRWVGHTPASYRKAKAGP